jgi:sec-independent protein translocase protein TatB
MFEVGFTELLLIFALALVVLGPRRLPELAAKVGRWVGKARAMARQLREQLDQEVTLEENDATRRPQPASAGASAGAATSTPDDSNLDVDSEGRPYYPPDHHGPDRPGATPSIVPPASPPDGEPAASGESSPAQQAADERRGE